MFNNIYMGRSSAAKVHTHGKVNEDWEILNNAYATAYDSINNIMLTKQPGEMQSTTIAEVRARFAVMRRICHKYAPHLMDDIATLEHLTILNVKGSISDRVFLQRIRHYVAKHGLDPMLAAKIEAQINAAEGQPRRNIFLPVIRTAPAVRPRNASPIMLPKIKFPGVYMPKINQRPFMMPQPKHVTNHRNRFIPLIRQPRNSVYVPKPMPLPKVYVPKVAMMPKLPHVYVRPIQQIDTRQVRRHANIMDNPFIPKIAWPKRRGR